MERPYIKLSQGWVSVDALDEVLAILWDNLTDDDKEEVKEILENNNVIFE